MPSAQMEPNLDQWINFCAQLTPYENFALIGYLSKGHRPPLSILATSEFVNEESARSAEKWADSKLRQILLFLCKNQKKVEVADVAIDKSEFAKQLAPLIVSTFSVPLGIAVAIILALLPKFLAAWCTKYREQKYSGKGIYKGGFPEREVESYFEIAYLPPITETVHDPEAYPLKVNQIKIKVQAESTGRAKVSSREITESIVRHFATHNHSFNFFDVTINRDVFGLIDFVRTTIDAGGNFLVFGANGLQLSPSTSPIN